MLRRVVTVAAGGKEGKIFTDDFGANNLGTLSFRGHMTSLITLALQRLAAEEQAPEVSFVHDYPGFVKTGLSRELKGIGPAVAKAVFAPLMALLHIPIEETGERHTYFATSARFPPRRKDGADGVALGHDADIAIGVDGLKGGGAYSIDYEAEGTSQKVQDLMKTYMSNGTADKAWAHTDEEYMRITGSVSLQDGS
ncbi:hypothetical protein F4802DRAFT_545093 [Xylaria palmicola]|nr:hypothetical protein F4802DRAFT_545093 [Xylaria palmicola]